MKRCSVVKTPVVTVGAASTGASPSRIVSSQPGHASPRAEASSASAREESTDPAASLEASLDDPPHEMSGKTSAKPMRGPFDLRYHPNHLRELWQTNRAPAVAAT